MPNSQLTAVWRRGRSALSYVIGEVNQSWAAVVTIYPARKSTTSLFTTLSTLLSRTTLIYGNFVLFDPLLHPKAAGESSSFRGQAHKFGTSRGVSFLSDNLKKVLQSGLILGELSCFVDEIRDIFCQFWVYFSGTTPVKLFVDVTLTGHGHGWKIIMKNLCFTF